MSTGSAHVPLPVAASAAGSGGAGGALGAVPDGVAESVLDWAATAGADLLHFEPPVAVERTPIPVGELASGTAAPVPRFIAPAAALVAVRGGVAMGRDGAVIAGDGTLLLDTFTDADFERVAWLEAADYVLDLPGMTALVAGPDAGAEPALFIAQTLARIALVRAAGIAPDFWITPALTKGWQREALAHAGIDPDQVLELDGGRIRAEHLLVTTPATLGTPAARERLRRLLGAPEQASGTARLLLVDDRAPAGHLAAGGGLCPHLTGFAPVAIEALPWDQQLEAIWSARQVVAPCRAGLGHLLHAPAGGHLVEVALGGALDPTPWALAQAGRWRYDRVRATCRAGSNASAADVDLAALHAALAAATD